jgi:hypothetical protein
MNKSKLMGSSSRLTLHPTPFVVLWSLAVKPSESDELDGVLLQLVHERVSSRWRDALEEVEKVPYQPRWGWKVQAWVDWVD